MCRWRCRRSCFRSTSRRQRNAHASTDVTRYQEIERRWTAENTPGWRWCLNPKCSAGQVHISPASPSGSSTSDMTDKPASPPSADICSCTTCGHQVCVPCNRPWHTNESCASYRARAKDRLDEEEANLEAVLRYTKPCPKCKRPIEKDGGCTHMRCSQCTLAFCWQRMWEYGKGGVYCKCRPQGF